VEQAVATHRRLAQRDIDDHQRQRVAQGLVLGGIHLAGGQRRQFTFDHQAGADDLERAVGGVHPRCAGGGFAGQHVDARAHAHLDQAFDFERDQRLAHRRPRHAQLGRQVALGRQPGTHREFAGMDQRAQLVGDLAVQAAGCEGLDGHGAGQWVAINW